MANFIVTNLNNSGAGSLRDAVTKANAVADSITFAGWGTITLTSELALTNDLAIDGDIDGDFSSDTITDWQDGVDKISIAPVLERSFAGLTFTGNGTTQVIARGFNGTGSAIIVKADAAFTLDASDFLFV